MSISKNISNTNLANNIERTEVVGISDPSVSVAIQNDTDLQLLGVASMLNDLMLESEVVKNDLNIKG